MLPRLAVIFLVAGACYSLGHAQTQTTLRLAAPNSALVQAFKSKHAAQSRDRGSLPWPRLSENPPLGEGILHVIEVGDRYLFEHTTSGRVYFVSVNRLNGEWEMYGPVPLNAGSSSTPPPAARESPTTSK